MSLVAGIAGVAQAADSSEGGETEFTGSAEAGSGSAAFRLGFYNNSDSGDGNPFLDEELTVIEPILLIDYNITDRLAAWGQLSYDYVSSASIDRLSEFPNQSGASGDYYIGLDLGARYELDEDRRIGGFVTGSTEYDYTSFGLGGDIAQDFGGKDATVKLAVNGFYDSVDVIRFNGLEEGSDERISISSTLSWYQILNASTHSELGANFSYQNGFLETAFNAVVVENPLDAPNPNLENMARGTEFSEELPSTRLRGSLFGRTRYSLRPGTAVELGGRFYLDSWGILGVTVEPRIYHQLSETVGLKAGYRYYTQTAADDYEDHFTMLPSKRTQDSDLADFDSHGINGGLQWQISDSVGVDLTAGYTVREDGIDQIVASFGIKKSFGGLAWGW